ncbi:AMP-binding protein [Pectobacteriaceae bacterium CE90]|nr:AMP-binding protein [Pectobacteriaceae bacterium CE90]
MFSSMMQAIVSHLDQSGDTIAIISPDGQFSCRQVAGRVQAIVDVLQQLKPTRVLVFGHKELDTLSALLACAYCGIAFTVVDSANPLSRVVKMAEIYQTDLILDGRVASQPVCDDAITHYPIVALASLPDSDCQLTAWQTPADNPIFYVLSTSGSTGLPKGVKIGYAQFGAFYAWYREIMLVEASNGAHLNHARLSFDMGLLDLFTSLALAKPLIMLCHAHNAMPRQNLNLMRCQPAVAVTSWFSTPSFLEIMCLDPQFNQQVLAHLQLVIVGGEFVSPQLIDKIHQRFPQVRVMHGYGPTETACLTHLQPIERLSDGEHTLLPLGKPRGNNVIGIENDRGEQLPIGEVGEVVIYGEQVGLGYLPESHPKNVAFGGHDDRRFYRTGDYGFVNEHGELWLKGRIDRQVKWHGNRVELAEIEAVACRYPLVSQAAAVPVYQHNKLADVIMFLQLHHDTPEQRQGFVRHISEQLPKYMVPTSLHYLQQLPLSLNGKIDHQALLQYWQQNYQRQDSPS